MILYAMVESKAEKATDFMSIVFFSVTYLENRKHDARLGGPLILSSNSFVVLFLHSSYTLLYYFI